MSDKIKTAFLGGSFNPVHKGHIAGALEAAAALELDRLVLIPNACPPHKDTVQLDFDTRVKMLKLAVKSYSNIEISDIESDSSIKHYTFNTLSRLKELYPHDSLYFIIGTDSLYNLHTWYRGFDLITLANLVCIKRGNELNTTIAKNAEVENFIDTHISNNKKTDSNKLYMLDTHQRDISSNTIRKAFSLFYKGDDTLLNAVKHYIDESVLAYILDHHLYKN
ncbi:Nicotinate-nucleotide adenylyltransferase [Anaerobiospirillum thomasii]|uniref:nicotinate (nicotinamide) nucleotide adenylyltransferase n=1 Tax=Anaerobiospirillum thomasii TaxID=179995 RepID=UPI000D9C4FB7|nr:nicotinate (nicotinamide) nucleotide adenylyltransferase [Anaerobiospirillum thomasii]SPT71694.1 Nicotinate-nucleotide adenylyltransferase [Anaerobiospirillum thomasii]